MCPHPRLPTLVVIALWVGGSVAEAAPNEWRVPDPLGIQESVDRVPAASVRSSTSAPERLVPSYVARSVRIVRGHPIPSMQVRTGALTREVGPRLSDLADLLPDTPSVPGLVPRLDDGGELRGVALAIGLVSGVLLTAASGLLLPARLPLLAIDRLRLGVMGAATAVASEWLLAQQRKPVLARLGRLVDAVNDDVADAVRVETAPAPDDATLALLDLYKRSVIHHLSLPTGGDALWRNGGLLDVGPAGLRLPELVADVPEAKASAEQYVRDVQRGIFWTTASTIVELTAAATMVGALIVASGALFFPLMAAGVLTSIGGLVGSLIGATALGTAREGFVRTLDLHAHGLATRVGAGLVALPE